MQKAGQHKDSCRVGLACQTETHILRWEPLICLLFSAPRRAYGNMCNSYGGTRRTLRASVYAVEYCFQEQEWTRLCLGDERTGLGDETLGALAVDIGIPTTANHFR